MTLSGAKMHNSASHSARHRFNLFMVFNPSGVDSVSWTRIISFERVSRAVVVTLYQVSHLVAFGLGFARDLKGKLNAPLAFKK